MTQRITIGRDTGVSIVSPRGPTRVVVGSRGARGQGATLGTPQGPYDAGTSYSAGAIVVDQGASWIYLNTTPGSGHAPPTLPTAANAYWQLVAAPGPVIDPGDILTETETFTFDPEVHLYALVRLDVATETEVRLPADAEAGAGFQLLQVGLGQAHFVREDGGDLRNDFGAERTLTQWSLVVLLVESNVGGAAANWVLAGSTGG